MPPLPGSAVMQAAIAAALLLGVPANDASAQAQIGATPPNLLGTWTGDYVCPQGKTGLTLLIDRQGGPAFTGYFHFYPLPENDRPKEGCYAVSGTIASDGTVKIIGGQWITQPPNYVTVDLQGRHNANEPSIAGDVLSQLPPDQSSGCGGFKVVRTAETANPPLMCQAKAISTLRPDRRPPAGPRASQTSRHTVATSR